MRQRPRDGTTLCRQANRRACPGDGHEVSRRPAQRDRGDHCYYSDRLLGLKSKEHSDLTWETGGVRTIQASEVAKLEALDRLHELRFFARCIEAWEQNETALPWCAVGRTTALGGLSKKAFVAAKNVLKSALPVSAYEGIKKLLGKS